MIYDMQDENVKYEYVSNTIWCKIDVKLDANSSLTLTYLTNVKSHLNIKLILNMVIFYTFCLKLKHVVQTHVLVHGDAQLGTLA